MTQPDERRDDDRQLDRTQYPWQFEVKNRFNQERLLGFGTTTNDDGEIVAVVVGPDNGYLTIDADTCKQIGFAWLGLCQRLADEQGQARLAAQENPES